MSAKSALTLMNYLQRVNGTVSRNVRIKTATFGILAPRNYFWRTYVSEKSVEKEKLDTSEKETATSGGGASPTIADLTILTKKLTLDVDALTKELKAIKEKNEELTDKYKRALADSENLRVRLTKQISDAKVFGIQSFCKDLLEVADTLGHATNAVPKDEICDDNPHLKSLYQGLTMTQSSLAQVFKRHGLQPLYPLNEKFDPNYHEALFQKEDTTAAPGTVIEVTKLGYKLHERCIRPALVGVSKS